MTPRSSLPANKAQMDYHFTSDPIEGYAALFSMGHEALGHWLTSEIGANPQQIGKLLDAIQRIEQRRSWQFELQGKEYSLQLTPDEAIIQAHSLYASVDELNDAMDYYDSESSAHCGLDDFKAALIDWCQFVGYPSG